jgi:hypothetical protein
VVLVVVVIFDATSLLPAVAPVDHGILPPLDGNTRRRDGDHGGGIPLTACGGPANVGGSSSRGGGGGGSSGRGRGSGGNSKQRTMQPLSPFSSLEALAKESSQKKEKAEKFYFYLRQQLLRKLNLNPIFSKSRFGTIANKNKKRIMAGTQYIREKIRGKSNEYVGSIAFPGEWLLFSGKRLCIIEDWEFSISGATDLTSY